jgi:sRNA-binding carbon storage regulator CsrA
MIVISRAKGEGIVIGNEEVLVTVLEIKDDEVLLEVYTQDEASIETGDKLALLGAGASPNRPAS